MEDFEQCIDKNVDRDGCDLLTKQYNNTLIGSGSPPTRQTFRHYCRRLGMDLNPGYQSDVLVAKCSQFVIKISNTSSYVLRAFCVEI
jgi:hypothetical protein